MGKENRDKKMHLPGISELTVYYVAAIARGAELWPRSPSFLHAAAVEYDVDYTACRDQVACTQHCPGLASSLVGFEVSSNATSFVLSFYRQSVGRPRDLLSVSRDLIAAADSRSFLSKR